MEGEFTSSEQQTTESRNATVNNPNGCFQNRLWGSLSGNHNAGNLVISGKDKKLVTAIHIQIDNMAALPYLVKMGGDSQSRTATSSQGNMGLSVSQWNSSYSRVLTKQSEYSGRLAIQKSQRYERLEIEPQNVFSDCENQRNT